MTNLENNLQSINAKYVRLSDDEKKRNISKLNEVLNLLIDKLKSDELFNALYSKSPCFAGSYYDGLKVSKPNEYDIDILLDLPKLAKPDLKPSAKAGYVSVSITLDEINKQDYLENYRGLSKLIDKSNCLSIEKVNQWFEGLVQKAVNILTIEGKLTMKKSGPAKTVRVSLSNFNDYFDIDLVPCFFFMPNDWPTGYRLNNINYGFFIVPKPLKTGDNTMWRASFQYQEKEIIKDIGRIKPAMRLVKVLRDKQNFPLKSYFIKTVFMWEISGKESFYRKQPLSITYLEMLRMLESSVRAKKIDFYWNKGHNLLEDWSDIQCSNVADRLHNIIKNIEKDCENVWKYYGSSDLPPRYEDVAGDNNGNGNEAMATIDNNWGLIGGLIGGVAAIGLAAAGTYALVRSRQRNNN